MEHGAWSREQGAGSREQGAAGQETWSIVRLGSGEMTVLLEKSTLLPERLPLNLPCLPFRRCTNPRVYFLGIWTEGTVGLEVGNYE